MKIVKNEYLAPSIEAFALKSQGFIALSGELQSFSRTTDEEQEWL